MGEYRRNSSHCSKNALHGFVQDANKTGTGCNSTTSSCEWGNDRHKQSKVLRTSLSHTRKYFNSDFLGCPHHLPHPLFSACNTSSLQPHKPQQQQEKKQCKQLLFSMHSYKHLHSLKSESESTKHQAVHASYQKGNKFCFWLLLELSTFSGKKGMGIQTSFIMVKKKYVKKLLWGICFEIVKPSNYYFPS